MKYLTFSSISALFLFAAAAPAALAQEERSQILPCTCLNMKNLKF